MRAWEFQAEGVSTAAVPRERSPIATGWELHQSENTWPPLSDICLSLGIVKIRVHASKGKTKGTGTINSVPF